MSWIKNLTALAIIAVFLALPISNTHAQENQLPTQQPEFYKAQITAIEQEGENNINGLVFPYQLVSAKILDGPDKGQTININHGSTFTISENQKVKAGEKVVIVKSDSQYQIIDKYRLNNIAILVAAFFVLILLLGKLQGLGAISGMIVSLAVIILYIVPQILQNKDPLTVTIVGAAFICTTTMLLAHGMSRKTFAGLFGMLCALTITVIFSTYAVDTSSLTGMGSDDAYSLRFGQTATINLKGLLLAGIVIGTIGILDDVAFALSSAVFEIKKANPKLKSTQLYKSAMKIGNEHVASLVNTLVLAYAGSSLPIFIFITVNPSNQPMWTILNSEFISEEIIRTLVGSIGLILAIPITALIASKMAKGQKTN